MKRLLAAIMMICAVMGAAVPAMAFNANDQACQSGDANVRAAAGCSDTGANVTSTLGIVKKVLNVVIGFVGIISVITIIVAGINMAVSNGESGKVAKARQAIIYAVIGLAVAIASFAIVNFVLGAVFNS